MKDAPASHGATSAPSLPAVVGRAAFQAELDRLRLREKAHTREGDGSSSPITSCGTRATPRPAGRPMAQWPRLEAGRSDDLSVRPA
jgi:hypothetical protein